MPIANVKCRSKVFPCPAGERCPEHRAIHEALDYSIEQQDFNRFLDLKNKLLPGAKTASLNIAIDGDMISWGTQQQYENEYKKFSATFAKEEKTAVYFYTEGDLYRPINHWLRNSRDVDSWPSLDREVLTNLDNLHSRNYIRPNPETPLWRGVSGTHAEECAKYRVGQTVEEKAYTSTSSNPGAVKVFTNDKKPVILQIFTAKGIPVSRRLESEYLLPRGMKFKMESRKHVNLNLLKGRYGDTHSHKNALLLTLREIAA